MSLCLGNIDMSNHPLKLHLGCGTKRMDGWVNVDAVKACHPDLVHDLCEPLPYPDMSVDVILAEDILEHFDKYMRYIVFSDWARVLKIGGEMTLQVPNFKKLLLRFFKFGFDNFVDMVYGENMWRSEIYNGHYGNHKWGYSARSLNAFVGLFGIESDQVDEKGLNLRFTGHKVRHVPTEELDAAEIPSHANKTGEGKDSLPVGFVRGRIKEYREGRTGSHD